MLAGDAAGLEAVIACERRGDEITRDMLHRLNTSFVTPFDREDIHELAEELDDVVDDMLNVVHKLELGKGVAHKVPELTEQGDLLVRMADEAVELIARLESMKGISPHLDAIDRLETEGDVVYRRALARLFSGELDALEALRARTWSRRSKPRSTPSRTSRTSSSRSSSARLSLTVELAAVIAVVGIALAFDFVNGFHDAANSIATVVSTRVLTPRTAVAWATFFNFVAFLVFGTHVAATIAKDVVLPNVLSIGVVFAGLIGAIGWNLVTFYLGLPSSSSHALVGGIAGAAVAKGGFDVLVSSGLRKIGVFIILSPLVGLALGMVIMTTALWVVHRYRNVDRLNRGFRLGQLASAAAFSLGHGGNDAQKTMGIILAVLITAGHLPSDADVPLWVVLSAHVAIGLGTLSGGWRIVKTMGSKITKLQPVGGVAAESAAAVTLFFTSSAGIPVSTTHTITGAIVGVGATRRLSAVRWGVAGRVVWAWVLTIPGAWAIATLCYAGVAVVS